MPLLHTKLHPPGVAQGPIRRNHLFDLLDRGEHNTVTLVTAPAGYGKSVLLTTWLAESNASFGWISLDKNDNDFAVFLQYLIETIQRQHPKACHKLAKLSNTTHLPDPSHLAHLISDAVISCGKKFLLVLDDLHLIHNIEIHDFLSLLIQNAPPLLRLIILSRSDPPLPLNTLRSQGRLTEIRMQDLRFQPEEVTDFLKPFVQGSLSKKTLENLNQRLEGWPAGLRLVSLNLRHCQNADRFLGQLGGSPQIVREYLMNQVLAQQPSPLRERLLKIAILDRFSEQLCEDLCLSITSDLESPCEDEPDSAEFSLIPKLLESNLFIIALDDNGIWYRFHHLFQDFLLDRLNAESGEAFIATLHAQAARWYASQGLLEEAVAHALKGDEPKQGTQIVNANVKSLFESEQKVRLMHLIRNLPATQVSKEPAFLLLQAWSQLEFLDLRSSNILDQVEALLEPLPADNDDVKQMRASLHVMRCGLYYECTDTVNANYHAGQALALLKEDQLIERGTLLILRALLLQMEGFMCKGKALVFAAFEDITLLETPFHTRLLAALCFMHWMEADLEAMQPGLQELDMIGKKLDLPESISHSLYFKAIIHYEKNEIDEAEDPLTEILEDYPEVNFRNTLHSTFALALVYEAQGRFDESTELIRESMRRALEFKSPSILNYAEAMQAEIYLRHGQLSKASLWAKSHNKNLHHANVRFFVPEITLVKIFIAENTKPSLKKALGLIKQLIEIYSQHNNKRFLIHILVLKVTCLQKDKQEDLALDYLHQSILMAQPGGFIRLFVDEGVSLIPLLNRLKLDVQGLEYVGSILSAIAATESTHTRNPQFTDSVNAIDKINDPLIDAPTERELEVLLLLASRLSNKEIGEKLFIAPGTVKRHTNTLYRKLNVHGRQEAVAKARGLGLLPTL